MEKAHDIFNIDELADYLKIPKSTLYKLVRESKIPAQKVGRHWRFHKETIDAWLGNRNKVVKSWIEKFKTVLQSSKPICTIV